jgi:type I restriction enzyme S subunit
MPSKPKTTPTKEEAKPALVPKLRFPEFRKAEEWSATTLGELGAIVTGKTPSTKEEDLWGGEILFITPTDITEGEKYQHTAQRTVVETTGTKVLPPGSVVYTCIASIGKMALTVVPSVTNQQINAVVPNGKTAREFIYYSLANLTPWIKSIPATSTLPIINKTQFSGFIIPHPEDKAEQQKIAECLSSVDELIAAQARKVDALKTHKKGLMQQLFPREGETQPRLRFPEFQNAREWAEEQLDDLVHFQDGFSFKSTDFVKQQDDATQVIRITDINNKNTNEDKVYIPTAFLESNKLGKYRVDDGDLILSLTGAAGFNFFFWNGGPAAINQRTAKVTSKRKSGDTLLRLLEPLIHEKINERGEGQNNNLSKEFLITIALRVPEPAEQQRIAECLTSLDALITAETQKLEALKTHKKGLMQQLFPSPEEQRTL